MSREPPTEATTDGRRQVLVVGGTGMLRPAVHDLLADGAQVLVVARRPKRAATGTLADDRLTSVVADWTDPAGWREAVRAAVDGAPIHEALLWVHPPHDRYVHRGLDELLSATGGRCHEDALSRQYPRAASRGTRRRASRERPAPVAQPRSTDEIRVR